MATYECRDCGRMQIAPRRCGGCGGYNVDEATPSTTVIPSTADLPMFSDDDCLPHESTMKSWDVLVTRDTTESVSVTVLAADDAAAEEAALEVARDGDLAWEADDLADWMNSLQATSVEESDGKPEKPPLAHPGLANVPFVITGTRMGAFHHLGKMVDGIVVKGVHATYGHFELLPIVSPWGGVGVTWEDAGAPSDAGRNAASVELINLGQTLGVGRSTTPREV